MSYAVRNDGLSWRAVNSADDCMPDEFWQESAPGPIAAPAPTLQQLIDAECQKHGIANEVTLEGLLGGTLALAMLNGKTIEQLAAENAAFKLGMTLRATFAQWRAQA